MDNSKISIITATYNSASTVRDTLESVKNQSYNNIEHLIIDGLSKDETLNICNQYHHIANIHSEKDDGIYDAMNKGINLATGDIIGILNSDDFYINNDVIEKVANAFKDDVDAVYGDLQYVDPINTNKVIRTWRSGNYTAKAFLYGWMPPHPTFFVRREVYEKIGAFNTALHSAADYEFMLRVLFKHRLKAAYIPEVLVRMRAGGLSNASLGNRVKANLEDRLAWKMNGLKPYFFTLYLKPVRKILQFIIK
jgi:glycosyltransferase involved in cell wall biosynthesis